MYLGYLLILCYKMFRPGTCIYMYYCDGNTQVHVVDSPFYNTLESV